MQRARRETDVAWFGRNRLHSGARWAVPEQALFDEGEHPAARLLRRRVRREVTDEPRNARIAGQGSLPVAVRARLSAMWLIASRAAPAHPIRARRRKAPLRRDYLRGWRCGTAPRCSGRSNFLVPARRSLRRVLRAVRAAGRHHRQRRSGLRPRGERNPRPGTRLGRGVHVGGAPGGPAAATARRRMCQWPGGVASKASTRRRRRGISTTVRCQM